jgi:hypothetical protein
MNTANADFFATGRMSVTSVAAPSAKPTPMPMMTDTPMGRPHSPHW